jgi:phosphoserine aminotransferase
MAHINQHKANLIYRALDDSGGFYQGRAELRDRSLMNVVFNLPTPELEVKFLAQAQAQGFSGLAGHRALGGVRASIYNALTPAAVETLVTFMRDFQSQKEVA